MFHSKKLNLLFVASPKTGTVSIHEILERIDPSGSRRVIDLGDRKVTAADIKGGIIGHASAKKLRAAIGEKAWADLNTITFIRDPKSKLVSAYHFNKKQSLAEAFQTKGKNLRYLRTLKTFATILLAKMTPFSVYIFLYKMKGNIDYCTNDKGELIVKYIGRTEYLHKDFNEILAKIGIEINDLEPVKHLNQSKHESTNKYLQSNLRRCLFNAKYKKEVLFYNTVAEKVEKGF